MAKLVDALPSGGSVRKDVQVRILFWARSLSDKTERLSYYVRFAGMCPDLHRDSGHEASLIKQRGFFMPGVASDF